MYVCRSLAYRLHLSALHRSAISAVLKGKIARASFCALWCAISAVL